MHQIKQTNDDKNSEKNISIAFFLNLGFTLIEFAGGLWTNSVAILSDALHDLGDSISLGLAWYLQKFSRKKSDSKYTYGYKRFSVLAAIINSVILSVGSVFILTETIPRIFNPQETNAKGMFLLSILGILVNGAAVWRLRRGNSLNEKVVSLHLWEDVLGWAAIMLGSIIMYFFDVPIIDPLLSVGISIYILWHVYKNIQLSIRIVFQGAPNEIAPEKIRSVTTDFPQIHSVHDIHSWTVDGNYHIATLHIVLHEELSMDEIASLKSEVRYQLHDKLDISHTTIEFETIEENCSLEDCC